VQCSAGSRRCWILPAFDDPVVSRTAQFHERVSSCCYLAVARSLRIVLPSNA
jgi:hypothetical protein